MDEKRISRRGFLKGAALVAGAAAIPLTFASRDAIAGATKAAMHYQDHPNAGKKCAGCMLFKPGKSASAAGTCAAVDGPISPNGWCMAFTPKAK